MSRSPLSYQSEGWDKLRSAVWKQEIGPCQIRCFSLASSVSGWPLA